MTRKNSGVGKAAPRPWLKFTHCKVCGNKVAVNNYDDRQIRVFRRRGVVVCPWCREGAVAHYIMTRTLANATKKDFKKLQKEAKKLLKRKFTP